MLIYFAAPLFSRAERSFNEQLTQKLEALGFRVFLPQRDGVEKDKPPYDTLTPEEHRKAIFHLDKSQVLACDTPRRLKPCGFCHSSIRVCRRHRA
jgi:nucleoside 2-deoxyribosyltransferase